MYTRYFPILLFTFGLFGTAIAQNTLSMSDVFLKRALLTPGNLRQVQWIKGSAQFTHTVDNKLVRVDATSLTTDTLDLLGPLNAALQEKGIAPLSGLPPFEWTAQDEIWFHTEKDVFSWNLSTRTLTPLSSHPVNAENIDYHPVYRYAAYTLDNTLHVNEKGRDLVVAASEKAGIVYGKSVHRDEFGIYKGTYWSPKARKLAFYRMDESMVTEYPIYVLDSMPAVARTIRYPYAGAKSHHVTIGVFDLNTQRTVYLDTGAPAEQYLTNVCWTPDERFILVAVVNREQNHLWLRQYDANTGKLVNTLLEEMSEKWVEPEHPAEFLPGSNDRFLWQSEGNGFNHLYLCDLSDKTSRPISKGDFPVTQFYGFSADGQRCFYQCADETGLNRHIWSSELNKGQPVRLTTEDGVHSALLSADGNWMIDMMSDLATPRLVHVQKTQPKAERKLVFAAKNPLEQYQVGPVRLLNLPSPSGVMLNARLVLPPNYDNGQQYPALLYVYNGPHVQLVTNSWLGGADLWMQRLASLGYVVISVDGRGSAHRGFAFESAVHRRLGDFEMEDQLVAVQYLKGQTYIDPARIGVYGWSYGGFMATSLMTRPEAKGVFRCGIAGGPVLDWRMYEIMYTERYMDSPQENPAGYEKNSLYQYVPNLDRRLLMIHGTSDPVVLWQHSLRYVRECVRKGRQVDYFNYPEHEHNVIGRDRVHLFEQIERYLLEHL
jgi:dipeptidyl-peptidase 4